MRGQPLMLTDSQSASWIKPGVEGFLAGLVQGCAPGFDRNFRVLWKGAWGPCAFSDRAPQDYAFAQTQARKRLLQAAFDAASELIREQGITAQQAPRLRAVLQEARPRLPPPDRCLAAAVDAALVRLALHQRRSRPSVALCYSAFGDIAEVARVCAQDLKDILGGLCNELHVIACAGLKTKIPNIPSVPGVRISIRNIALGELFAFSGIKAPALFAACADAVRKKADMVVTIDGDGRLPLFEILPALAALLESPDTDAALGSRRVPGAWVSKPGSRHLTSWLNCVHVNSVLGPVLGPHVHDPQAIFRIYRGERLNHALERLGCGNSGLRLCDLQDGSLACELMLLANLRPHGFPNLVEIPVIETMAYPANPTAMPIVSATNMKAMVRAANRVRRTRRGQPLLAEGSESLVLQDAEGAVLKVPRFPERLGEKKLLPASLVADNRLLDVALRLPGPFRTLFLALAGRRHPDRGFGLSSATCEVLADTRPEVQKSLPLHGRWAFRQHAFRLPLGAAIITVAGWIGDRWFLKCGELLEFIGRLPPIAIRLIAGGLRIVRFWTRIFRAFTQWAWRHTARFLNHALDAWIVVHRVLKAIFRRTVYCLELAGVLRVFAFLDLLHQRNRIFRDAAGAAMRLLVELRWLLESVNVCIDLKRPVLCTVYPTPVRPVAQVLAALPSSMTAEFAEILRLALERYRSLGEQGYLDGELSLDNLAFELADNDVRVVLVDTGALVRTGAVPPEVLVEWLAMVQTHFTHSHQVWKLRESASGPAERKEIVETFVEDVNRIINQWILSAKQVSWFKR